MVVFCPNAGLLSGIVLSIVPLLLPFHWQCLLLPVLPAGEGRLELIEAPVPFVLGVMYKTSEVRSKCGQLVRCVPRAGGRVSEAVGRLERCRGKVLLQRWNKRREGSVGH
jgi:hypothetical protein